jgi:hypothetical protein
MKRLDEEIRFALRRCEPPQGFAERVMRRLGRERAPRLRILGRWAAAAAAACLVVGLMLPRYLEYRRGQQARQQLMLALHIAAEKIAVAQSRVEELNRRSIAYE